MRIRLLTSAATNIGLFFNRLSTGRASSCRIWIAGVALLIVTVGMLAADAPPAQQPDTLEKLFGLKAGPGRELVLANCLPCHSTAIVAANHLKRERWAELIALMQDKHGMRRIDADTQERILNYLEVAQRPDDAGLNVGKETPWAAPLYRPNPIWD